MHKFYKVKKGQIHSVKKHSNYEVQAIERPKTKKFSHGFAITNHTVNQKILADIGLGYTTSTAVSTDGLLS